MTSKVGRLFAIFCSIVLTYSSAAAGINAVVLAAMEGKHLKSQPSRHGFFDFFSLFGSRFPNTTSAKIKALQQAISQYAEPPLGYTDVPGPVYLGDNPSRDPIGRGGIWNDTTLAALQNAQISWGASAQRIRAQASTHPIRVPSTTGDDTGSGPGYPWEPPVTPPWGPQMVVNPCTGNVFTSEPIVAFPSIAGTGVNLVLYHNSQSTYDFSMGKGWSNSYEARIFGNNGDDVVLRWGDGTCVPYTFNDVTNKYVSPPGVYDTLVWKFANGGYWTLTRSDQTVFTFDATGHLYTIKDRNGNGVGVGWDGNKVTSVGADARSISLGYDTSGHLISITDPASRSWTFAYNASAQLTRINFPSLNSVTYHHDFTYDSNGLILSRTDCNGKLWQFGYGPGPEGPTGPTYLTSITSPMNHVIHYDYVTASCTITLPGGQHTIYNYSGGILVSIVDAAGFSTAFQFSNSTHLLNSVTDKRQKTWNFGWNNATGMPISVSDPLGHTTSLNYDTYNEVTSVVDALGHTTQFTYDLAGNLLTVKDALNNIVQTNTYDLQGQLSSVADAYGNQYTIGHDGYGDVNQITDPLGHSVSIAFNQLGEATSVTDALSNTETYTLDNWERTVGAIHPDGTHLSATADAESRVTSVTDELGHVSGATYNDDGQLTGVTDADGHTQTFTLDANGWLTSSNNALGNSRTYGHTATGQISSVTLPTLGTMYFWYNANGDLSQYENTSGPPITYNYDDAARQTSTVFPDSSTVTFAYDSANRPTSMTDASGTSTVSYDADSNVTQRTSAQGTVNYTYDLAGRAHTMQRAGAGTETYYYDAASRLTSLVNQYSQTTSFSYDNADRITQTNFSNGTYSVYGYDNRSRLTSLNKYKSGGVSFRAETYNFDADSNLLSKTVGGTTTSYTFDDIGQLLSETSPGYAAAYTYDANGNRLTKTLNGITDTYVYDAGDKLQSVTNASGTKSYTYDGNGRTTGITTSAGTTAFNYDFLGHITSIVYPGGTTNTNVYNGLGTRVKRIDSSTGTHGFVHDGLGPASDVLFDGGVNYTPGISERGASGQDRFYNDDALGSLTDLTDSSGNFITQRTWDAYGMQKSGTVIAYLHGYHENGNYEEDKDSGLKLLGYRCYDPTTGRFLTPDPGGVGSNWYSYCRNTPATFEDPAGLWMRSIFGDGARDDDHSASADNVKGWWDGNGLYCPLEVLSNGLDTGLSGVECVFSLGFYDGGARQNDDGFDGARNLAKVGGLAACAAGIIALLPTALPAATLYSASSGLPQGASIAGTIALIGNSAERLREDAPYFGADVMQIPSWCGTNTVATWGYNVYWIIAQVYTKDYIFDMENVPGKPVYGYYYPMERFITGLLCRR